MDVALRPEEVDASRGRSRVIGDDEKYSSPLMLSDDGVDGGDELSLGSCDDSQSSRAHLPFSLSPPSLLTAVVLSNLSPL